MTAVSPLLWLIRTALQTEKTAEKIPAHTVNNGLSHPLNHAITCLFVFVPYLFRLSFPVYSAFLMSHNRKQLSAAITPLCLGSIRAVFFMSCKVNFTNDQLCRFMFTVYIFTGQISPVDPTGCSIFVCDPLH